MRRHDLLFKRFAPVFLTACLILGVAAAPVPSRLTDEQFWNLSRNSSEEDGYFRSDNLLSNETSFQEIIPDLLKAAKTGRVYMGVGPEQNFTYMTALRPSMAFIIDIRHGNLDVHLLYKALFEISKDRAEFVSRLFSRKRPPNLTAQSSVIEIFRAYSVADGSQELYEENLKAVEDQLLKKHGFPLSDGDREGIRWALSNYYRFGPSISYNSSLSAAAPPAVVGASGGGFGGGGRGRGGNNFVNYGSLMTSDDGNGEYRSFLASEESFQFLKDLESRNMVVPVVGDFGGDKAIRAVGKYLKSVDAMVAAFYLSNVEQFLTQDGKWDTFCGSVLSLPIDASSTFIRTGRGGPYSQGAFGSVQNSSIGNMTRELRCEVK